MGQKYWLVGEQGSGKTTLAVALAAQYDRPGIVCALQSEFGAVYRYDAVAGDFDCDQDEPALLGTADFLFSECHPRDFDGSRVEPRDMVIFLKWGRDLQKGGEVAHG